MNYYETYRYCNRTYRHNALVCMCSSSLRERVQHGARCRNRPRSHTVTSTTTRQTVETLCWTLCTFLPTLLTTCWSDPRNCGCGSIHRPRTRQISTGQHRTDRLAANIVPQTTLVVELRSRRHRIPTTRMTQPERDGLCLKVERWVRIVDERRTTSRDRRQR